MAIAEVIRRGRELKLRLGYSEGEGIVCRATDPSGLVASSFVKVQLGADEKVLNVVRDSNEQPVVVAAADTALADIYRIAFRAGVRMGTTANATTEAAAMVAEPHINDSQLRDLTKIPFVTIDYETSKDLDQAVYVERVASGYRVLYALADAAAYIDPGMDVFVEALARGTSFYLPGLTIPMLPQVLSEGLISLNPNVDRRAFVFAIDVDGRGEVLGSEIYGARIHCQAKLTYDGVQAFIDSPQASPLSGRPFSESLRLLKVVGELRIARAKRLDIVRYDRIGTELRLPTPTSKHLSVSVDNRNGAQRWNEQISLLTNIVGAKFLLADIDDATGLAGLFRVHPGPDQNALDSFAQSVEQWVDELELDDDWRWRRGKESLADYVERLPCGTFSRDNPIDDLRRTRALTRQAMIMGNPSTFSTEAAPHFGVGADAYSRFSSPMREIVGIVTMHIARQQLAGESLAQAGIGPELIDAAAAAGNRANRLQKKLNRAAAKLALDQLLGSELERPENDRKIRLATVLGVSEMKVYLLLDDPPMEVKLYVPDQPDELALVGRFELAGKNGRRIRVGEAVKVRVAEYAKGRERWVLKLQS